jgi:hypothetical protein
LRSVNCSVILQSSEEMFYMVKRKSSTIG